MKDVQLADLAGAGVVAVLRAPDAELAIAAADALVDGGIRAIEVTYTVPDAAAVIREIARRHPQEVLLGAGTIRTVHQAAQARAAGAGFLVCPGSTATLAAAMRDTGATVLLGALTPTEVMAAVEWGADAVKIFPASLGGPGFLRALAGPFPDTALVPTGGVTPANLGDWFRAGAVAVGAGSDLCPPRAIAEHRWDVLRDNAIAYVSALDQLRVSAR